MEYLADEPTDESKDQKEQKEQIVQNSRDRQLREAADRVYRRYGSDLSAFYRDLHKHALYKRTG